jgi:hypothetical protein
MRNLIKLSNDQELIIEEGDDRLYIGVTEKGELLADRWLLSITTNGVTVWEGGKFAKTLVKGLEESPPEDIDPNLYH